MSRKKLLIICLGILALGILITSVIFITEPEAKSEGATKETAMLVDVIKVHKGTFKPIISATGTVQPVEDVMISPLVGGQVIKRSSAFIPGGFVKKGELLLQIDPADYRNALELRNSELMSTQTDLNMEMGRQQVAEQDLQLIGLDSLSNEQKSLVLRQPQLRAVEAQVKAAQASVNQAELNLQRTAIRAPFDAHILSQNVTEGSQVSPGDNLGRLVGTQFYWVIVNIPVNQLKWLSFPRNDTEKGSLVKLMSRTAWPEGAYREGYLFREVGALNDQTRLARVLVRVSDPLAHESENSELPKLMIGAFVDAQIQAEEINDVVRIDRDYVRSNNTVWVMQEGKLMIKNVKIELSDSQFAYVFEGLEDGDIVVTTNLSAVAEGLGLRTGNEAASSGMIDKDSTAQKK